MSTSNSEKRLSRPRLSPVSSTNSSSSSSQTRPHRRRRHICPEPGSLYDIIKAHAQIPLFSLPICWTDLHAKLLGARFVALDPVLTPVPSTSGSSIPRYHPQASPTAAMLARELTTLISTDGASPVSKIQAIKSILSTMFPTTLSRPAAAAELDLHFGGKTFPRCVRFAALWKKVDGTSTSFDSVDTRPASSFKRRSSSQATSSSGSSCDSTLQPLPDKPVLAYCNRRSLNWVRGNLFRIVAGPDECNKSNTPVSRLQLLRSKLLTPEDEDHDAHYIALLLAMAQAHFHRPARSIPLSQRRTRLGSPVDGGPQPELDDARVQLITHNDENAEFIVYTAVVSAAFLRRFAEPARAPLDPTGMTVEYTKVPIWPILGLKERLAKALGRELGGEVSAEMETWETPEERALRERRLASLKRRRAQREALSEVFNRSFEVELEEDSEALSPAKRRCTKSAPSLEVC
jgi:hypothetical protein